MNFILDRLRQLVSATVFIVVATVSNAFAENVTIQYFLGGVPDLASNSVGVLVVDRNADGFDSVYKAGVSGQVLATGEVIANSDDVIIGVTSSSTEGFSSGTGFADSFASINYTELGLAAGMPVKFFWFPSASSSAPVLDVGIGFLSYSDSTTGTGGDQAYVLPAGPGVFTLTNLDTPNGGLQAVVSPSESDLFTGPILAQPVGANLEFGGVGAASVATQGAGPYSYQWYEGSVGDTSLPVGSNSPNIDLGALYANKTVWARVTDDSGAVDSSPAAFLVDRGSIRPELTWDQISGAEQYYLWINKDGAVWKRIWVNGASTNQWMSDVDMPAGNYTWWVAGWSTSDGLGSYGPGSQFSIGVPDLLLPEGKQDDMQLRPEFTWTATPGATWYYIYLLREGRFWKGQWLEGVGSTSWRSETDMPSGKYKWWVKSWNIRDFDSPWSVGKDFTLGIPEPLTPQGLQNRGADVEFTWSGASVNEWCQIYVNRNNALWLTQWVQTPVSSFTPTTALPSGEYDWWVRGWTLAGGNTAWSPTGEFTVQGISTIQPSGSVSGDPSIDFSWESEPGASHYQIWIGNNGRLVHESEWLLGVTNWSSSFDFQPGTYQWYIRPWGLENGYGDWTSVTEFEYDPTGMSPIESSTFTSAPELAPDDFNGDQNGDLILQNTSTGDVEIVFLAGDSQVGSSPLSVQPGNSDWEIISYGDVNADLNQDLLWENKVTGQVLVWVLENGTSVVESIPLGSESLGSVLSPRLLADFDSDGYGDLLLKNTETEDFVIWYMRDFVVQSSDSIVSPYSRGWDVVAALDFNGDDSLDLVFQNSSSGNVEIRPIETGASVTMLDSIPFGFPALGGRTVVAANDIDENGEIDLILQNVVSGELSVWIVEEGVFSSESVLDFQPATGVNRVRNLSAQD